MKGIWRPAPGRCLCQCGEKVRRNKRGKFNDYIAGHNEFNGRENRKQVDKPRPNSRTRGPRNQQQAQFIYYHPRLEGEGAL
jgi:hypothetical protein